MFLVTGISTSGLINRALPLDDASQPWPVSVAAALYDDAGEKHQHINLRVRAAGRLISPGATEAHGISSRDAERCGVIEAVALAAMVGLAADAEAVVGFGMPHIRDVVVSALLRAKPEPRPTTRWLRPGLQHIDLIPPAAAACKLPSEHESGQYRWPRMEDACRLLLGTGEAEARRINSLGDDAWSDMERAAAVFFQLKSENMIELGPAPAPIQEVP